MDNIKSSHLGEGQEVGEEVETLSVNNHNGIPTCPDCGVKIVNGYCPECGRKI